MSEIIIITGQTATGKTSFALNLARKCSGELINCDSRQIYKRLHIITGKDFGRTKFTQLTSIGIYSIGYYMNHGVKIWLYDVVDPKNYFSSHDYTKAANYVIRRILSENKTPIVVGGSYLYVKHLLYGFETGQIPPDWKLRKQLGKKTIPELQRALRSKNLNLFQNLNNSEQNNPQRLIRKIEIASTSTYKKQRPEKPVAASFRIIGFCYEKRDNLVNAIKKRVLARLKQGAIAEVQNLLKNGYTENDPGLKTIGYNQIFRYLKGELTKNEAINQWITKEIQYAKRQYTFMKKDSNIDWRLV